MRFVDVARWSIGRMGFAGSDRMDSFPAARLSCDSFEQLRIPLGVVATDVVTGEPLVFRDPGDVDPADSRQLFFPGCGWRHQHGCARAAGASAWEPHMSLSMHLHSRTENTWKQHSDLMIEPYMRGMERDAFRERR